MRVVLDSTILVRAFSSPDGLAHSLLVELVSQQHCLILSGEMLHEVAKVLRYPRMLTLHRRDKEAIYDYVQYLSDVAELIPLDLIVPAPIRDRGDVFILQTAVLGEADFICTDDRDFFSPPASVFLANSDVVVLTDVQLIERLR